MSKKIFIIACEPSGDAHAANLIKKIHEMDPSVEFQGLGGPSMKEAGVKLHHDMTTFSALGFGDVIRQYFDYRRVFYGALEKVNEWKPDSLILIDSPAFNLRFAKKIKKKIPVLYYISPQIWAWGGRRIKTIKKTVSKMLVILPFEKQLYTKAGVPCEFVGHPLLDHVEPPSKERNALRKELGIEEGQKAIGLMPGSREKEINRIFPAMMKSAALIQQKIPNVKFFLTQSPNVPEAAYQTILDNYPRVKVQVSSGDIHHVLHAIDFALITSGTATTEAALVGTPFFLMYRTGWLTYILGRLLIRIPYLGLVNILANRKVVPEFIQRGIKPVTIAHETQVLFENSELYEKMKRDFVEVAEQLGTEGASARAAKSVLEFMASPTAPEPITNG